MSAEGCACPLRTKGRMLAIDQVDIASDLIAKTQGQLLQTGTSQILVAECRRNIVGK